MSGGGAGKRRNLSGGGGRDAFLFKRGLSQHTIRMKKGNRFYY